MHATSRGFPLFVTFDLDAETMWTARDPAYAGVGLGRLMPVAIMRALVIAMGLALAGYLFLTAG